MRRTLRLAAPILLMAAVVITLVLSPGVQPPERVVRIERPIHVRIGAAHGGRPTLEMRPFTAEGSSPDLAAVTALVGDVLRADLAYEDVFDLAPVPSGGALAARPADGVLTGLVRLEDGTLRLELRILDVACGRLAFAREYAARAAVARLVAHVAADEVLGDQGGVRGLACSRLAFVSDRLGVFHEPTGSPRHIKEIFVSDYDGGRDERVTVDGDLDLTPAWSPDGRLLAYTSYRLGYQDIFVTDLATRRQWPAIVGHGRNWLPAWSPDGKQIAFSSSRDGNEAIYLMNTDRTGLRRLTTGWAIDTSPAWSPDGRRIAFTSNRTGSPQIWVMDADGANPQPLTSEKYCDRPSWSPGPVDEIVYVSQTRTGFDIKVIETATRRGRQLTFGSVNESPTFSPNGRHIAFTSTRSGSQQIWTMTRMGTDLRQVTRTGNNSMPAWSR
jgi:TolB protein